MKKIDLRELFFESCTKLLNLAQIIRQSPKSFTNFEFNEKIFKYEKENYEQSFENPEYLNKIGFNDSDLLSIIYSFFKESISHAFLRRPLFVWEKNYVINALEKYRKEGIRDILVETIDNQYLSLFSDISVIVEEESASVNNIFREILDSSNESDLSWMVRYGVYITPEEKEIYLFWSRLNDCKLNKIAFKIVEAFFHGFISQSRVIGDRNLVRLRFSIGQEPLAKRIIEIFYQRGFEVIILKPNSLGYCNQFIADHNYSKLIYNNVDCYKRQLDYFRSEIDLLRTDLSKICGFINIGSFGGRNETPFASLSAYRPKKEILDKYLDNENKKKILYSSILKPDTLSFCSIVFPDYRVGDDFEKIFDEFFKINTEDSLKFELIQAEIINDLDKCSKVVIEGFNENITYLTVKLQSLKDENKETLFLNCGGDLNIPYGEVFTTPQLVGTNGILHIKEIYLRSKYYKNLILKIEDGYVVDYNCSNFSDSKKNKDYVKENLLQNCKNPSIGEFAIGTNTQAYKVLKAYDLLPQLPILLMEKLGPHIAVGDPCFARGERSPVYDLYSKKEMTARWNERTNLNEYINFHTDITIPFEDIKEIYGITYEGERISIIKNGLFVQKHSQLLNENL